MLQTTITQSAQCLLRPWSSCSFSEGRFADLSLTQSYSCILKPIRSSSNSRDTVLLRGKMRKDTVLIVLADDEIDNNKIRINKVVRGNLRLRLGTCLSD
jgi:hypothetical protein